MEVNQARRRGGREPATMTTSVNKEEDSAAMAWPLEACHRSSTGPDAVTDKILKAGAYHTRCQRGRTPGLGSESSAPRHPAPLPLLQSSEIS